MSIKYKSWVNRMFRNSSALVADEVEAIVQVAVKLTHLPDSRRFISTQYDPVGYRLTFTFRGTGRKHLWVQPHRTELVELVADELAGDSLHMVLSATGTAKNLEVLTKLALYSLASELATTGVLQ